VKRLPVYVEIADPAGPSILLLGSALFEFARPEEEARARRCVVPFSHAPLIPERLRGFVAYDAYDDDPQIEEGLRHGFVPNPVEAKEGAALSGPPPWRRRS
jgi:hypothetical protein